MHLLVTWTSVDAIMWYGPSLSSYQTSSPLPLPIHFRVWVFRWCYAVARIIFQPRLRARNYSKSSPALSSWALHLARSLALNSIVPIWHFLLDCTELFVHVLCPCHRAYRWIKCSVITMKWPWTAVLVVFPKFCPSWSGFYQWPFPLDPCCLLWIHMHILYRHKWGIWNIVLFLRHLFIVLFSPLHLVWLVRVRHCKPPSRNYVCDLPVFAVQVSIYSSDMVSIDCGWVRYIVL